MTKKILMDASNFGELAARANAYAKRFPGSVVWKGRTWEYSLFLKETNQEDLNHFQIDERFSWFYEAVGVTVGMMDRTGGAGQVYRKPRKTTLATGSMGENNTPRMWRRNFPWPSPGLSPSMK